MRILFFLLSFYSIYSQDLKKEIFLDINGNKLSRENFLKKLESQNIGFSIFESDSLNTLKLVKSNKSVELFEHYKVGKIDSLIRKNIISELKILTNKNIEFNDIIVLNFYIDEKVVNQSPCIEFYTNDKQYINFFKKSVNKNIKQFFITNSSYYYNSKKSHVDTNRVFENYFFSEALSCGNYIIIFPNDEFILKFGEYRQEIILQFINDYLSKK